MFTFIFTKKWYLTHPWDFFSELFDNIRWAWQRVFRGWDDRAWWNVDSYVVETVTPMLRKMKENQLGYPASFEHNGGMEAWKAVLDKIIEGFEAANRINDGLMDEYEWKAEMKTFRQGMCLFTRYFFNLWD